VEGQGGRKRIRTPLLRLRRPLTPARGKREGREGGRKGRREVSGSRAAPLGMQRRIWVGREGGREGGQGERRKTGTDGSF